MTFDIALRSCYFGFGAAPEVAYLKSPIGVCHNFCYAQSEVESMSQAELSPIVKAPNKNAILLSALPF